MNKREPTEHEQMVNNIEINLSKDKGRVAENLQKEAESVDPRLMCLKLKKAFLEQYGRINACDTKINDFIHEFNNKYNELRSEIDYLKLPFYKKLWLKICGK